MSCLLDLHPQEVGTEGSFPIDRLLRLATLSLGLIHYDANAAEIWLNSYELWNTRKLPTLARHAGIPSFNHILRDKHQDPLTISDRTKSRF